jgi:hypothetical protein
VSHSSQWKNSSIILATLPSPIHKSCRRNNLRNYTPSFFVYSLSFSSSSLSFSFFIFYLYLFVICTFSIPCLTPLSFPCLSLVFPLFFACLSLVFRLSFAFPSTFYFLVYPLVLLLTSPSLHLYLAIAK